MPLAYRLRIEPVSDGTLTSVSSIKKGVFKQEGIPHEIACNMSSAQIMGVMNYLGLIKAGSDTSTVETAITALSP